MAPPKSRARLVAPKEEEPNEPEEDEEEDERGEGQQYKENSRTVAPYYMRYGGEEPLPDITAEELLDPNPEGVGEEELMPKNAGMREPGPFASAYKCPYRIYKNPIPMRFIWK